LVFGGFLGFGINEFGISEKMMSSEAMFRVEEKEEEREVRERYRERRRDKEAASGLVRCSEIRRIHTRSKHYKLNRIWAFGIRKIIVSSTPPFAIKPFAFGR
jgi:hypothetical protein